MSLKKEVPPVRPRTYWEDAWSREDFDAPWRNRHVAEEIVRSVEDGWFPPGTPLLDIGCGRSETAAWTSSQGFPSMGIDYARSAVENCRASFGDSPPRLEYHQVDICKESPPDWQFQCLIDRCCLYVIPKDQAEFYRRNLLAVASPGARMILFMPGLGARSQSIDDPKLIENVKLRVEHSMGKEFSLIRTATTWLDEAEGNDPVRSRGALVCWLERAH